MFILLLLEIKQTKVDKFVGSMIKKWQQLDESFTTTQSLQFSIKAMFMWN